MDDDISSIRNKIFLSSMHVLEANNNSIDDAVLARTIEILKSAKRVIILGYGTSAVAGYDLFVKLSRLGIDCHYSLDSHVNALVLAEPREGDVLFCHLVLRRVPGRGPPGREGPGNGQGDRPDGRGGFPLAGISDVCIAVRSFETAFRTDAMVSRMVQITIIDILFTASCLRGGDAALARPPAPARDLSFLKF
ncbi:MAG: hypothetical protein MZV65_15775 [Chromatiales bacterium]|nr:hypothetical protein [Chromatiales bacterium]